MVLPRGLVRAAVPIAGLEFGPHLRLRPTAKSGG